MHALIPKHTKVSERERESVFKKHGVDLKSLPRILIKDTALKDLDVIEGDVIKIVRKSPTAGEVYYYRRVVKE